MRLISVAYDLKPQYPFEPICARFLGFRLSLGARYRYSGGSLLKQEVGGRLRHWDQKPIDNERRLVFWGLPQRALSTVAYRPMRVSRTTILGNVHWRFGAH